jgi:hypothetical protein
VTGPLGSSVTIGTGQLSGTLNLGQLPSTVVNAYTFNSYSVNAAQITAGVISVDRLDARVTTSDSLSAQIARIPSLEVERLVVREYIGTPKIFANYINNVGSDLYVMSSLGYSVVIDGRSATLRFVGRL